MVAQGIPSSGGVQPSEPSEEVTITSLGQEYVESILGEERATDPAWQAKLVETVKELPANLAEFRREVFSPNDFNNDEALLRMAVLQDWLSREVENNPKIRFVTNNRSEDGSIPSGYCLVFTPVTQQAKKQGDPLELLAVLSGVVPSYDLLTTSTKGKEYIIDAVESALVNRLANVARRSVKLPGKFQMPFTVDEYISRQRGVESLAAFRKIGPAFVDALKKRRMTSFMTLDMLRLCLSNATMTDSVFGDKMPSEAWDTILDAMIRKAEEAGLDPGIFKTWKATRHQAEALVEDDQEPDEDEQSLESLLGAVTVAS